MNNYEVYISYRKDGGEALACLLNEKLKKRKIRTYYDADSKRVGEPDESVYRIINQCSDVLLVLSGKSLHKCNDADDLMRKEIIYALEKGKNIVPVMLTDFDPPTKLTDEIDELNKFTGVVFDMEMVDWSIDELMPYLTANSDLSQKSFSEYTQDDVLRQEIIKNIGKLRETNSGEAMYNLAKSYEKLHKDSMNVEIANLYLQAAKLDYAPAQNAIGVCYYHGVGVEKDIDSALYWFNAAAQQGESVAVVNLARVYKSNGYDLAYKLLCKAAEMGDSDALYELGVCYEYGHGVEYDFKTAKEYYKRALDAGCAKAYKKLKKSYWIYTKNKEFFDSLIGTAVVLGIAAFLVYLGFATGYLNLV